jgi:integral membrane sensor domain MASE1
MRQSSSGRRWWFVGRASAKLAVELLGFTAIYIVVAKLGLALASIHPSATPIWPATGLALAALLVVGRQLWPAIFTGALVTNITTAGSIETSLAIATGNTLEAVVGAYLISRWTDGSSAFETPTGVARFALISSGISTPISATMGSLA